MPTGARKRSRMGAPALMSCAIALLAAFSTATSETFTPRLDTPRVAPLAKGEATPAQQAMLASRPDFNIYKTLARHVDLYNRWSPLGRFILNGSGLAPREREIVMLRMGWLCQSEYEWAQHARIGKADAGLTSADIRRIAEGPRAQGWLAFDRTLLQMVDELRYEAVISDATWQALRSKYSAQQAMEALYTAAQYQLVSMALNSLGIQLDPGLEDRLPTDLAKPALAALPKTSRPAQARIPPLSKNEWSEEQRLLIEPELVNGTALNVYATMLQHPKLYGPRREFGSYLQRHSLLDPRTRELLIMRTASLLRSEYVWAHHVRFAKEAGLSDQEILKIATGPKAQWSEKDAALLRAADELRREAFITNETWATLSQHYDTQRLIEIVYTVGGYTMTALATNSFGIQLEPGQPPVPGQQSPDRQQ